MMKELWRYIFFVVILMVFHSSTILAQQQEAGPRIVVEENWFDARQVKEGDIIGHTFKVFNKGDSVLNIKDVKPG